MKKCPYCYTLMNDDVNTCPKCLKSMNNVAPMKEVAPKNNQISFYGVFFGIVIVIGSIFAALSQKLNAINYMKQYQEIVTKYNSALEEEKESLKAQGDNLMSLIKTCEFRKIAFYVMCGIGVILFVYYLVKILVMKNKKIK